MGWVEKGGGEEGARAWGGRYGERRSGVLKRGGRN